MFTREEEIPRLNISMHNSLQVLNQNTLRKKNLQMGPDKCADPILFHYLLMQTCKGSKQTVSVPLELRCIYFFFQRLNFNYQNKTKCQYKKGQQ